MMLRPRVISERDTKIREGRVEAGEDNYVTKIIKYIPAESVAAYLAATGIIATAADIPIRTVLWIIAVSLFVFTFLWQLFGASGKSEGLPLPFYQAIVSTIAFAVWVSVVSGDILIGTGWNPVYGSLLALAITLFVPLLEKVFVRPKRMPESNV
jgi:hypothetical protein